MNEIEAHTILELVGKPEEHIQKMLDMLLVQIDDSEGIQITAKDVEPPEETEDGLYGTFAELTVTFESVKDVTHFALNYSPASLEILEPDTVTLDGETFNSIYGDILAKIHMTNTEIVELQSQRKEILTSLNSLVRNTILILCEREPHSLEQIAEQTGIDTERLEKVLSVMVKNNTLTKDKNTYTV